MFEDELDKKKKKNSFGDIHEGTFTNWCNQQGFNGVTNECIQQGKQSQNETTRKRAQLAENFRRMARNRKK